MCHWLGLWLVVAWAFGIPAAHAAEAPGTKLWDFAVTGPVLRSPALGQDGTIYFGYSTPALVTNLVPSPGGFLVTSISTIAIPMVGAITHEGVLKWTVASAGEIAVNGNQIYAGGLISESFIPPAGRPIGETVGSLTALTSDGVPAWSRDNAYGFALGADQNLRVVVQLTNAITGAIGYGAECLSPDGTVRWRVDADTNHFNSPPELTISPAAVSFLAASRPTLKSLPSGARVLNNLPPVTFNSDGLVQPWHHLPNTQFEAPIFPSDHVVLAAVTPVPDYDFTPPLSFYGGFDSNGHNLWQSELTSLTFSPAVVASDGTIYLGTTESNLCALTSNGLTKWQFSVGAAIKTSPALAQDGTVYCTTEGGILFAISANGGELWRFTAGGPIHTSPAIDSNGVVYFGSDDGKLYAIQGSAPLADSPWPMYRHDPSHTGRATQTSVRSASTPGTRLWATAVNGKVTAAPALAKNGTIYFGYTTPPVTVPLPGGRTLELSTNYLCAVTNGGRMHWETQYAGGGTLAVGTDQTIYTCGTVIVDIVLPGGRISTVQRFGLNAFRPDRAFQWQQTAASDFAIGAEGSLYTIIQESARYRLLALAPNGTVLRHSPSDFDSFETALLLIGPDGSCFLGPNATITTSTPGGVLSTNLPVRAFDAETLGNPTPISDDVSLTQTLNSLINPAYANQVIGADGARYFGSADFNLYAYSSSGVLKWQFNTSAAISTSPALAQDGTIYCTTEGGVLFAISSSGEELWRFNAGGPIHTSPAIGTNGVVYFGADDGKLYAIQGAAPLADSPWPMYRHDAAHTGRAFQMGLRPEVTGTLNQHQLRLSLEPFVSYRVDASTDLIHWQPSFSYSGEGGIFRITRNVPPENAQNFYRITTLP